jgi:hypothetical protein
MNGNEVSNVDSVNKCPICGWEIERGYAVTSRGLWWATEKHAFSRGGKLLSKYPAWTNTNFPALRCCKCHIIIFDYEKKE